MVNFPVRCYEASAGSRPFNRADVWNRASGKRPCVFGEGTRNPKDAFPYSKLVFQVRLLSFSLLTSQRRLLFPEWLVAPRRYERPPQPRVRVSIVTSLLFALSRSREVIASTAGANIPGGNERTARRERDY